MAVADTYCGGCYGAAAKAGRTVRQTSLHKYPVCAVCESRLREGLVHYLPSNGTEAMMFQERCEKCRHCSESPEGYPTCALKILDRMCESGWEDRDSIKSWYDPADLRTTNADGSPCCPAECLKFSRRSDGEGRLFAPPPPDCAGQLTFDDLDVPVELPVTEWRLQTA